MKEDREFNEMDKGALKDRKMGVRTLAYLINKQEKGHYVYFEIKAEGQTIKSMSRTFELSTDVLKYLFINPEKI